MLLLLYVLDHSWDVVYLKDALLQLTSPEAVPLLDGWLMSKYAGQHARSMAELRGRLKALDQAAVARIEQRLEHPDFEGVAGAFQLLRLAASDEALALVARHACRRPYVACDIAEERGKSQAALAVLAQLADAEITVAHKATVLAAEWGDAEAKRRLPKIQKRFKRHQRGLDNL